MCAKECSWLTSRASEGPHFEDAKYLHVSPSAVTVDMMNNFCIDDLMKQYNRGAGFVGVAGNASVDPNIGVCQAGVVQLNVDESCELVVQTVRPHIGGHCAGGDIFLHPV